jgi:hypothetical protein
MEKMLIQRYWRLITYTTALSLPILPSTQSLMSPNFYRADGVRITHDPYAPGMAEKYGTPGNTDSEGFDPYADTVGADIWWYCSTQREWRSCDWKAVSESQS